MKISEEIKNLLKEDSTKEERDLILGITEKVEKLENEYAELGKDYIKAVKGISKPNPIEPTSKLERLKNNEEFVLFEDVLDAYLEDSKKGE